MPKRILLFIRQNQKSLSRSTVTSFLAGVVDFGSLYFFVEYFHVYYVWATSLAALLGAITNFTLNRIWAFDHGGEKFFTQAYKYGMVSSGSLILNTAFVYFFTEYIKTPYMASKVITALMVSFFWNYPLHRYYVFPKKQKLL